MSESCIIFAAAWLFAAAPTAPADVQAQPETAAVSSNSVQLDVVARVGDDDARVQQLIADRLATVIGELGGESSPQAEKALHVVVEAKGPDFVVKLATSRGDKPLARAAEFQCQECSGAQLLDRLASEAKPVLEALLADEEEAPEPEPAVAPPPPVVDPPTDTPPPSQRLGPMGQTGVGLLVVGIPLAATGAAFVGLGERRVETRPTMLRNFTPTGVALLVSGCVAVITGAVLLGIDRKRAKKRGAQALWRAPAFAGVPTTWAR